MESQKPIFKAGTQSSEDPFVFVLSDESSDRSGDIIRSSGWSLSNFKNNPVALFGHDHEKIIGIWEDVRVEAKRLLGRLKLAAPGTSELIDTTRSLIEQRLLRAVSVGFAPLNQPVPISKDEPWGGLEYTKQELLEASVVAVPCNQNALAIAKAAYSKEVVETLFVRPDLADPASIDPLGRSAIVTPKLDRWLNLARQKNII